MKKVMGALEGRKRYLLLLVFVVQAVAEMTGHPIGPAVKTLLSILGWSEGDALVSSAIVAQLVASVYAIFDGVKKDQEKREAILR